MAMAMACMEGRGDLLNLLLNPLLIHLLILLLTHGFTIPIMDMDTLMPMEDTIILMLTWEGRGDLLNLLLSPPQIHLLILLLTHGFTIPVIMDMDTLMPMQATIILMDTLEGRGGLLNLPLIPLLIPPLILKLILGCIILLIILIILTMDTMDTPMDTTLESKQVPIFDSEHIMDLDTAQ